MAYLNKDQYAYRRESAAQRNAKSAEIGMTNGMTEEQAEAIAHLCSARHEMHCNIDRLVHDGESRFIARSLQQANEEIHNSGLPRLTCLPLYDDDCIHIDDLNLLSEWGDMPDINDDTYQDWFDTNYERIYQEWSDLNDKIEAYLREIDEKFSTSFAPTGKLRNF